MDLVELTKRIFIPASYIFSSNEKKVIAVAWKENDSILLTGGKTVHRAFKLPMEIDSYSKCYLTKHGDEINSYETRVIIWDESSFILSRAAEMVDELLEISVMTIGLSEINSQFSVAIFVKFYPF